MAPSTPRSERATRASTRTQTAKSHKDDQTSNASTKLDTGRVEKARTKTKSSKVKNSTVSVVKPLPKPKTERHDEAVNPKSSTSIPSDATPLTINDSRVKSPIVCHQYTPSKPSTNQPPFIFTHGAGGTLSAPAMQHFCTGFSSLSSTPLLAFQGSMNLGARVKGFHACHSHLIKAATNVAGGLVFGGRSMGARAAVIAATEIAASEEIKEGVSVVLVSYPLQGPKDVRDQILLNLPERCEVLFIVGEKDAMCPLELLEEVRGTMKAVSRVVVVRGADHGMNVKQAKKTREVGEESGRVAARWLAGDIEKEGTVFYIGVQE